MRHPNHLRALIVVLICGLVAASAPSADASTREARLEKKTVQLKAKLKRANARARRQATRIGTLEKQVAGLNGSVAQRTSDHNSALARATAAESRLAAIPSPLTRAVTQVKQEVAYTDVVLRGSGVTPSHGALVAHAAMSYVVGHVTAPSYGYMNVMLDKRPVVSPDGVLETGAGICGHAALTFAAIVKRFGYNVRSVVFTYEDDSAHIGVEVFYDGAWHYYDPTFSAYYRDGDRILSVAEARGRPDGGSLLVHDNTLFWYNVAQAAGVEYLGKETDPATRVVYDSRKFWQ